MNIYIYFFFWPKFAKFTCAGAMLANGTGKYTFLVSRVLLCSGSEEEMSYPHFTSNTVLASTSYTSAFNIESKLC